MTARKDFFTKAQITQRTAWLPAMAAFLLFSSPLFPQYARGQGKTDRIPIQKPSGQPAPKAAEKNEVKEAPKPQVPTPAAPQVPAIPAVAVDFELEMKKLESLLSLNDKNADAYFNRGWLYEYKGDLTRAVQDYSKAIDLDKKMKDAYFNRGLALARIKKFEEALKDLSEVIKMEPASPDAICNRGSVYFQMGKLDLALADYEAGLKINPNDADLRYNRGIVYLAQGNKAAAMEDLKKAAQVFHDKTRKEFPELAPQVPAHLRKAALECGVPEFLNYMSQETRKKVRLFEESRAKMDKAFEDLEKSARQILPDKVQRQKHTLAFSIQGTDPRWAEIFGPQWPEMVRQNPKEPRFFYLTMQFNWKEECQILQKFQACLENPAHCQETALPNSALQMKRTGGAWGLADGKKPQEWKQAQAMGDGMVDIIQWVNKFLGDNKGKLGHEEMILALAKGYTDRLKALPDKVKAVK
ncbi:MAG: tetratricopeptide repeat protein [Thermodesulfobacteriota bacterium]